jgi:guanylate kinase
LPAEQLVSIFILPETFDVLKNHILGRSKVTEEELERRLASARVELQSVGEFSHQVVNPEGQIEKGFAEVMSIIFDEAEKHGLLDTSAKSV